MTTPTIAERHHHLDKRADQLVQQAPPGAPDDLLTTREVAKWLGIGELWVELGRTRNYGPKFLRLGPRLIRYRRSDVLAWLDSRANLAAN